MTRSADAMASAARPGLPEPLANFEKQIKHAVLSRAIHQPGFLRFIGGLSRRFHPAGLLGSYASVAAVLHRPASFSNLAHGDDLPQATKDFLIGSESGPRQKLDRDLLVDVLADLAPPERFASAATARAETLVEKLAARASFDLIDDYLVDVVWAALRESFGPAASAIEEGCAPPGAGCPFAALVEEMRYVGAQLIGGSIAPRKVAVKAARLTAALKARVGRARTALATAWASEIAAAGAAGRPVDNDTLERNAVGLMWVGHPATVQAGALIVQSLLGDLPLYRALRADATQLGAAAWSSAALRSQLRAHVLELLRFRPPFPLLNRTVVRATTVDADGMQKACRPGKGVNGLMLAAMFDAAALDEPALYWPNRPDHSFSDPDNRYLMFGLGERSCIAKHQVVETLVSALTGVLLLPELRYARRFSRIRYDGPIIVNMPLRHAR